MPNAAMKAVNNVLWKHIVYQHSGRYRWRMCASATSPYQF